MNKTIFTSKTFWGILLTIASYILKQHNIEIPIIGDATAGMIAGGSLAAWGIRTAKPPVK